MMSRFYIPIVLFLVISPVTVLVQFTGQWLDIGAYLKKVGNMTPLLRNTPNS